MVLPFSAEGGIAKMVSNKLAVGPGGQWVLLFMHTKACMLPCDVPLVRMSLPDPVQLLCR